MTRLLASWRGENRRVFWNRRWEWGWLGNGWNRLALGPISVYFASGPSPRARLRAWLS